MGRKVPVGKKSAGSIAVLLLVSLYAFLQPHLNDRFGWTLPGLNPPSSDGEVVVATPPEPLGADPPTVSRDSRPAAEPAVIAEGPERSEPADEKTADAKQDDLQYGLLREVRPEEYLSPEGLRYLPGSAEGHRLEHLRRHTADMPSRPGKHGVFDGGMEGALVTIDQAYGKAKQNQRTTKQTDRDRTIYTVDMGRRVGYVGGSEGKRSRNPMARRVKLVLEGAIFITAYPL